jgi:hypothetical protein
MGPEMVVSDAAAPPQDTSHSRDVRIFDAIALMGLLPAANRADSRIVSKVGGDREEPVGPR